MPGWSTWLRRWRRSSPRPWVAVRPRVEPTAPSLLLNHADWQGRATVLLVDGDSQERHLVADILHMKGYTVLQAGHGRHALRVQARFHGRIDLLLTDVSMPAMNGPELVRLVRPLRPEMRVVWMPRLDRERRHLDRLSFGSDVRLSKPFTMRTLLELLRTEVPVRPS